MKAWLYSLLKWKRYWNTVSNIITLFTSWIILNAMRYSSWNEGCSAHDSLFKQTLVPRLIEACLISGKKNMHATRWADYILFLPVYAFILRSKFNKAPEYLLISPYIKFHKLIYSHLLFWKLRKLYINIYIHIHIYKFKVVLVSPWFFFPKPLSEKK